MMSREMPTTPTTSLRLLRRGTLVVRIHVLSPEVAEDAFLFVDQRSPGANDRLFVGEEFAGDVGGKKLAVGFADQIGGHREAHAGRRHLVANDEAAVGVLDPKIVRQEVDQGL